MQKCWEFWNVVCRKWDLFWSLSRLNLCDKNITELRKLFQWHIRYLKRDYHQFAGMWFRFDHPWHKALKSHRNKVSAICEVGKRICSLGYNHNEFVAIYLVAHMTIEERGGKGAAPPSTTTTTILCNKFFLDVKSKNIKFVHVSNMRDFSLFIEQDIRDKK